MEALMSALKLEQQKLSEVKMFPKTKHRLRSLALEGDRHLQVASIPVGVARVVLVELILMAQRYVHCRHCWRYVLRHCSELERCSVHHWRRMLSIDYLPIRD
jgi:hypothetical protein